MKKPLLCRLGFHKWRDYRREIKVFWQEPAPCKAWVKDSFGTSAGSPECNIQAHSKIVHEGHECKRCGLKLRRKLITNADGTLACVG